MVLALIPALATLAAAAGEPTVDEILARWEAGAAKVDSYALKVELESTTQVRSRGGRFVVDPPGRGVTLPRRASLIWRSGRKRRGEFPQDEGGPAQVVIAHGDVTYRNAVDGSGRIVKAPTHVFGLQEYEDYEALFRTFLGTLDRAAMSRRRASRRLPDEGRLLVVESPPSWEGPFGNFGWRAWLDPERNHLPVKLEQWSLRRPGGEAEPDRTIDVELAEVARGVWAPVRGTIRVYAHSTDPELKGKLIGVNQVTVDRAASRFGGPVDPSLFRVD